MTFMTKRLLIFAATLGIFGASAQADDRPPTAEERAQIESALKAAGYTSWGKIEFDDDQYWEVDNAIAADGKRYDLDLSKSDYTILKKELDTD